jgi:cobyrinic acid a,c-diamide synthase
METGVGLGNKRDGLVFRQTFAAYTHVHADGEHGWANAFVSRALDFARVRRDLSIPDSHVANADRRKFENYCLN